MSFGIRHLPEYLAKADRLLRRKRAVSDVATPPFLFFQAKSVSKVIKADIYPEFGTYPGGGESPIIPFGSEKNAEREVIHGRWAMLGVTGAWAAENGTGIPWFTAGTLCTPDDCTAVADKFPGAVAPLAPEGSGYPSFWAVLAIEVVLVGLAEAYRTGLSDPVFDELTVGDVSPGGRFDPSASLSPATSRSSRSRSSSTAASPCSRGSAASSRASPPRRAPSPTGRRTSRTPSTPTCSPTPPPASASTKRCARTHSTLSRFVVPR